MALSRGLPNAGPLSAAQSAQLSRRELLGLSCPWFALNFPFAALLPVVIPAQILLFVAPGSTGNAAQAMFLAVMVAFGAGTALVLQPLVGALSDRTATRFGRRRPYLLAGAIALLAGLVLLALTHGLAFFIAGLLLVVIANTISGTASQGLVPDCVPAPQRGAASGAVGVMTLLGTVGSLGVASLLLGSVGTGAAASTHIAHGAAIYYAVAAVVAAVFVAIPLIAVKENALARRCQASGEELPADSEASSCSTSNNRNHSEAARAQSLMSLWLTPWRHANFRWVFLTRAFVMLGLALFMTYIEYYFARVAHIASFVQTTAVIAIVSLLGAVGSTVLMGVISDRIGRRTPIVCVASACMAGAALMFVVAPGQLPLWPLGILFGFGYGAYLSVDTALAVDALPSQHSAGTGLGLFSLASTLPGVLAPLLGGAVIVLASSIGDAAIGYRGVFALATVFLILGAALVLKVREGQGHARHDTSPSSERVKSVEPLGLADEMLDSRIPDEDAALVS